MAQTHSVTALELCSTQLFKCKTCQRGRGLRDRTTYSMRVIKEIRVER